ncbi:RNA polymerase beta chain, putative [Medicago truncatula]|uniref:RNA polymerase beta chain, putative n=1 Tax=Medicago truncatula TaxID=3880 RepID=G7KIX5_MEDTR|nr:RNA polymerase beta chain, putative [Medicago truncatula]
MDWGIILGLLINGISFILISFFLKKHSPFTRSLIELSIERNIKEEVEDHSRILSDLCRHRTRSPLVQCSVYKYHTIKYEIQTHVTSHGLERITNKIPHLEAHLLRNLEKNGIVVSILCLLLDFLFIVLFLFYLSELLVNGEVV